MSKVDFFDEFSESLKVATGREGLYLCPICLREFTRDLASRLDWDHYPPVSIGGTRAVLVCKICNHTAGAGIEAHLPIFSARRAFDQAYPGAFPMVYKHHGTSVRVAVKVTGPVGPIEIYGRQEVPQKPAIERWTQTLEEAHLRGSWEGMQFQMDSDRAPAYNPRYVQVSLLKAGYLALFYCLGYPYILSPALDKVREQIQDPTRDIVTGFLMNRPVVRDRRTIIYHYVHTPAELRSFLVMFQGFNLPIDWAVYLPTPQDLDQRIYNAVRVLRGKQGYLETLVFDCSTEVRNDTHFTIINDHGKEYEAY